MKVYDLVGALFSFYDDYGIILDVRVEQDWTCSAYQPETWIKVGWLSGSVTWEEWETNEDCFEVISWS